MYKFKILLLVLVGLFLAGCQSQTTKTSQAPVYGEAFTTKNSLAATDLPQVLGTQDSVAVKVAGQVVDVCQAKGCWLDVKLTDNTVMKVRFKDYGFFVPKNIAGKTVVLNGVAYNKSVSVADQQHYAQDAGKTEAEIKAITQPQKSITFTATGVIVQ
ncbi:MAG: DUF4920 domain-containing protein [Adhaeribacter sp.]